MILLISALSNAQVKRDSLTAGYKNGTLILVGGRMADDIMTLFKKEVGGESAKIVIIPTAMTPNFMGMDSALVFKELRKQFEDYGFTDITILSPKDSTQANNKEFIKPLKTARGIYFTGGRQWKIADAFLNTKAHREMFNLLDRGGVIMGSSAGATIQGSFLARGDTKSNQIMAGDHETGLGFIKNIAIDQHVLANNRHFDLFEILNIYPNLLGIGIDEKTAAVIKQDTLEVIGDSYILVYDNSFWSRRARIKDPVNNSGFFYFLRSGDSYSLSKREVIKKTKRSN